MDNEKLKQMLLDIQSTELEFSVTMTGKESKRVNGLYKPETCEILLHNKNFTSDNQLIYTAIHEYAHHILNEEYLAALPRDSKGRPIDGPKKGRVHNTEFWARFHALLEIAEQKGYYVIGIEESSELAELTEDIRKNYLEANGKLMLEFGQKLLKAHELCNAAHIRYEDYIDRVLKLPRSAAQNISKVAAVPDVNPALGFENMKLVASIKKPDERSSAEQQLMHGKSPDSVLSLLRKKKDNPKNPREQLEKEKARLSKTIGELTKRLEIVEESLASLD